MLIFSDLQSEVKRRATRDQGGTQFNDAVKISINQALFRISREAQWRTIRRSTILPITTNTEEFNLPPQVSQRLFMWHEVNGTPYVMNYIPEQKFLGYGADIDTTGTPTHYRMWDTDMVLTQPSAASVVSIASSSSADLNIQITVHGIVSGYPDFEIITTDASNGTTSVSGSKSFTSIDRITKNAPSAGRITATSNTGAVTLAVLPVGDTTAGILYRKVKIYPKSSTSFNMNIYYYKDPYRLVNDGDIHELGQDFDEAIIMLATAKLNFEQNKDEGEKYYVLYKEEIRNLRKNNIDKIDWFPSLERPRSRRNDFLVHPSLLYKQAGSSFGPRVHP
jgi:hypothetical protein